MQLQTTTIVRNRGQLTIPESIRNKVSWVAPGSAVAITQTKTDQIVITPYNTQVKTTPEDLWRKIRLVRSFKGRGKPVKLSEFIAKDRESH